MGVAADAPSPGLALSLNCGSFPESLFRASLANKVVSGAEGILLRLGQ